MKRFKGQGLAQSPHLFTHPTGRQKLIIRNKTQTVVTKSRNKRIICSYLREVLYASALRPMFAFFPYKTDMEKIDYPTGGTKPKIK